MHSLLASWLVNCWLASLQWPAVVVAAVAAVAVAAVVIAALLLPFPMLFSPNNLCYAVDACSNAVINSGPSQCKNAPSMA